MKRKTLIYKATLSHSFTFLVYCDMKNNLSYKVYHSYLREGRAVSMLSLTKQLPDCLNEIPSWENRKMFFDDILNSSKLTPGNSENNGSLVLDDRLILTSNKY